MQNTNSIILFLLILLSLLLSVVKNETSFSKISTMPYPYNPLSQDEILANFKIFSFHLLQNKDLSLVNTISFNPLSIGHVLAVLNEKPSVLNVTDQKFAHAAFGVPSFKITEMFSKILRKILEENINVNFTSTIYTPAKTVRLTVGLGKLYTNTNLVDTKNRPEDFIDMVNSEVEKKILDQPFGKSFFSPNKNNLAINRGFIANTFDYESDWNTKWEQIPPKIFQSFYSGVTVNFMEASDIFSVYEDSNFLIIKLRLNANKQELLLVKSKLHINEWPENVKTIWSSMISKIHALNKLKFVDKQLKISLPQVNEVSGNSLERDIKNMSISGMCKRSKIYDGETVSKRFDIFLSPLAQLTQIKIRPNNFHFSSITGLKGVLLNRKKNAINSSNVNSENMDEEKVSVDKSSPKPSSGFENENIVFDQPFFWALNDENLGLIGVGAVILPEGNENINISKDFMSKFFSCESPFDSEVK